MLAQDTMRKITIIQKYIRGWHVRRTFYRCCASMSSRLPPPPLLAVLRITLLCRCSDRLARVFVTFLIQAPEMLQRQKLRNEMCNTLILLETDFLEELDLIIKVHTLTLHTVQQATQPRVRLTTLTNKRQPLQCTHYDACSFTS
jgi:hypothetical protein